MLEIANCLVFVSVRLKVDKDHYSFFVFNHGLGTGDLSKFPELVGTTKIELVSFIVPNPVSCTLAINSTVMILAVFRMPVA